MKHPVILYVVLLGTSIARTGAPAETSQRDSSRTRKESIANSIGMAFVKIPSGEFMMGIRGSAEQAADAMRNAQFRSMASMPWRLCVCRFGDLSPMCGPVLQ